MGDRFLAGIPPR